MKEQIKKIIEDNIIIKPKPINNYIAIGGGGAWICDFRRGFLNPEFLDLFCKYFWDNYEKDYPFQVGGIESGAIPFVAGIILEGLKRGKKTNGFYIRKTRKEKGLGNMIEGNINNEKIFIVDDLLNGGESLYKVYKAINNINRDIFKVFVFINYGNEKGQNLIKEFGINLDYVFTLGDFGIADYIKGWSVEYPLIYPKNKKLFKMENQNLFIDAPKSNPIIYKNNLIFGGESGDFFSINKENGMVNWKTILPKTKGHKNILSSPIIIDNNLVFGHYDGNIYFLDIDSGKIEYIFETFADFIGSSPTFDYKNKSLFIGLEHSSAVKKGSFLAINIEKKEKLWEKYFDDFVHCSPAFIDAKNFSICGGNDGKIIGVNSKNGELIFEIKIEAPIKGNFTFSDCGQYVFFGAHDNYFYKVDLTTGNIVFKVKTDNIIYTKPLVIGDEIFFGSLDKNFYHIDGSYGEIKKVISTSGKIFGEPIIIENNIISFPSNDGYIYFYDYINKKIIFTIYHGEKINNKIIYESEYGFLYVVDHVGGIYKYNIKQYLE